MYKSLENLFTILFETMFKFDFQQNEEDLNDFGGFNENGLNIN